MTPTFSPALLFIHVTMGSLAVASGLLALFAPKGQRLHRAAGQAFVVSMLLMAGVGAYGALRKEDMLSALNGMLACYLVVTSWLTLRRPPVDWQRTVDVVGLLAVLGIAVAFVAGGMHAAGQVAAGVKVAFPPLAYYVFALAAFAAAVGDVRMLRAGGVQGAMRIARHLWRMGYALFMAVASLFLGQQKVFPAALKGSPLMAVPVLMVVLVTLYWLWRVRFSRARPVPAAAG